MGKFPKEEGYGKMENWTNKQWWALIGGLAAFLVFLIGFQETAVVALFAIAGYFVGKYLDGEIDFEDIRARAQGRDRESAQGQAQGTRVTGGSRLGGGPENPSEGDPFRYTTRRS